MKVAPRFGLAFLGRPFLIQKIPVFRRLETGFLLSVKELRTILIGALSIRILGRLPGGRGLREAGPAIIEIAEPLIKCRR